ncbi:hypothetical protein [Aquitalea magnusonii]|uniref:hypothetical protein n=1 Tax=Aquitalea magnusonii TaxID=332411 RepID=UPI0011B372BC|nr:hypothetical protein [Aquitalea magnusonii]
MSRINIANKISCCTALRNVFLYFANNSGNTVIRLPGLTLLKTPYPADSNGFFFKKDSVR